MGECLSNLPRAIRGIRRSGSSAMECIFWAFEAGSVLRTEHEDRRRVRKASKKEQKGQIVLPMFLDDSVTYVPDRSIHRVDFRSK